VNVSRKRNESAPKLYIEFEDDDEAAVTGEAKLVSSEVIGTVPEGWRPRWQPGWSWSPLPIRYRKLVAGIAALAGLGAAIGDSLAAQAAQRAADRSTVSVLDANYTPSRDGYSIDLLLDVAYTGQDTLTVTQASVQSDFQLDYPGSPVNLNSHQQYEFVLSGQYDCSAAAPPAAPSMQPNTVQLTVRSSRGNVNTFELPLPKGAQLPRPWSDGRATFCALAWGG
jgi:hypothetical protein